MHSLTLKFAAIFCLATFSYVAGAVGEKFHYKRYHPYDATLIHVLTIDPTQVKIIAARAQDIGQGLDSVENIAKHFHAIAGINGGYFRIDDNIPLNAVPAGVLKIANQWHGIAYKLRGAIGWNPNNGQVLIDRVQTTSQVELRKQILPINAMNKLVTGNRASLLSDSYTNLVNINDSVGILILDQHVQGVYNNGNVTIPADGYVYNVSGDLRQKVANIKQGDSAVINIKIQPQTSQLTQQWNRLPYIVGGGPVLISNKKKITDFSKEKMANDFINDKYARTAIGILPNKKWVFVVAERNLLPETVGLTIPELRDFMYDLGCIHAVNLDGGGSSAMYVDGLVSGAITAQLVADVVLVVERD